MLRGALTVWRAGLVLGVVFVFGWGVCFEGMGQFTPVESQDGPEVLRPGAGAALHPILPPDAQQVGQAHTTVPVYGPTGFEVYSSYNSGEELARQLRVASPKLYSFDRASLRDVLRFLAEDAGIPFVSMLERVPGGDGASNSLDNALVTFTMRAAPFVVLESIARANDISLVYEEGIWLIRPINEREMIGRTYRLKYTPQERVTYESGGGGTSGSSAINNALTGGGSTSSGASIPNLTRQQGQSIFKVEEPALVKEIKNMLKIQTYGTTGKVARGEASVENFPALPGVTGISPAWAGREGAGPDVSEPTVTFNSDTNSIFIVATRQQHQWVEGFLAAADQPQALIGIEVKFFETTRDPKKDIGINWADTLGGDGFTVKLSDIKVSPSGTLNVSGNQNRNSQDGNNPALANYDYTQKVTNYQATLAAPYSAVLSASQLAFSIQAFMEDRETSIVQYPRVLTVNNREVAISNARNEPILGSSTESQTTVTTQTNQIEYLPIGTQLNILPKTMPDGSVFLNVAITVSNILGTKPIQTGVGVNEFPVTSSRIYQAALQVDSGYTLAVGGFEEAVDALTRNGVPLLKDIPGLGELFKSRGRAQNKKNLIVFITPTIIYNRLETSGISENPSTTLPLRPGGEPRPPAFTPDGQLVGGMGALTEAIRWLQFQLKYYQQIDAEARVDRKTLDRIRGILNTALMIQSQIPGYAAQAPQQAAFLGNAEASLESLISDFNTLLGQARRKIIY